MIPTYQIDVNMLDSLTGLNAISLVKSPAVEKNFLCFNDQPKVLKFDESKHIISGVFILADTPIYRYNEEMGEYYVNFSKEVIEKLVEKYFKEGLTNSVNLNHNDNDFVDGVIMIESYLKDSERGIAPEEFKDVPDGSWLGSFKVENDELWDEIIKGDKYLGFSVQGLFDLIQTNMSKETKIETIDDLINKIIN